MELIWLVLTLLVVDLAAFLFAADTRPGLQFSSRRHAPRSQVPRWTASDWPSSGRTSSG